MGGMNLVIHAIVVVTIGLVTSRMLLSFVYYYYVNTCHICKIKMNCKLALKMDYLFVNQVCFVLKIAIQPPLKKLACRYDKY